MSAPRFATVALDVDSTVCALEGIDWLAALRGAEVADRIAALTDRAMRGEVALDTVYAERLAIVRPTRAEVEALGVAYVEAVAGGAADAVHALGAAGVKVLLVSGGLREAIVPVARTLGISEHDLHAVSIRFSDNGYYAGLASSPLATQQGKRSVLLSAHLPRPVLMVGDGATDLAARGAGAADVFAAFTAFVRREPVVRAADVELADFAALASFVLPSPPG